MNDIYSRLAIFTIISVNAVGCVTCPDYEIPECEPGSQLVERLDEFMCEVASCEPMRGTQPRECPVYDIPECDEYSDLDISFDSMGCEVPTCSIDHGDYCPHDFVGCESGEELVYLGVDEIGCDVNECRPIN